VPWYIERYEDNDSGTRNAGYLLSPTWRPGAIWSDQAPVRDWWAEWAPKAAFATLAKSLFSWWGALAYAAFEASGAEDAAKERAAFEKWRQGRKEDVPVGWGALTDAERGRVTTIWDRLLSAAELGERPDVASFSGDDASAWRKLWLGPKAPRERVVVPTSSGLRTRTSSSSLPPRRAAAATWLERHANDTPFLRWLSGLALRS